MTETLKKKAEILYLILSGLFITSLVTSNLIFQKFFTWSPLGLYTFELSVGIIAYPLTFIFTDIISEIYGRARANSVVLAGLFAGFFTLLIVVVSTEAPATNWSPVNDIEFKRVFGFTYIAVAASLVAYLIAQFIDVQLFHFWKRVTNGRHLWLRNNASTFTSQFFDTFVIITLLCLFKVIDWSNYFSLIINGFIFKVLFALADTPFVYLTVFAIRRYFGLKGAGAEIRF